MRKRILVLLMITAATLNFGGCGMSMAGRDGERATESSVTGNVKSDDGEKNTSGDQSGSAGQLTDPFVTENCIYSVVEWQDSLVCTDLQGKHKRKYDLPVKEGDLPNSDKVRVGKEHVCYEKKGDLYVSPIRQTKDGEEIVWTEKEKIAHDVDVICILEPYLIYVDDTLYRYDFRTKESKPLGKKGEYDCPFFCNNFWLMPIVHEGKMYFADYTVDGKRDKDTMYSLDIEKWEVKKLPIEKDDLGSPTLAGIQKPYMCMVQDEWSYYEKEKKDGEKEFLECFDMETGRKETLKGREILDFLKKEKLWGKENSGEHSWWALEQSFQYGDRVYLLINMGWYEKCNVDFGPQKGKAADVLKNKPVLISCQWNNIKEITYEKEITEWWSSRVNRDLDLDDEGEGYEEYTVGEIYTLYNGELYMDYQDDKGYHLAARSMDTGEFREVTENETEYYLFNSSELS